MQAQTGSLKLNVCSLRLPVKTTGGRRVHRARGRVSTWVVVNRQQTIVGGAMSHVELFGVSWCVWNLETVSGAGGWQPSIVQANQAMLDALDALGL